MGVLLEVQFVETLVFVLHELAFAPFLQTLPVKGRFVAFKQFLDVADLHDVTDKNLRLSSQSY